MAEYADLSPDDFAREWTSRGRRRAYFVLDHETGHLKASHDDLLPLARALEANERDFDSHEAIFLEVGPSSGALMGAFLHRTERGQGQGGLRNWPYENVESFLQDGLRLARGMGRKNALAGLWWGGGKGIIARPAHSERARDSEYRRVLYREYGSFITSLHGAYVTAEDVGTGADDMAEVFRTTRFVTCVPDSVGGSGNPSFATARGVVCAMESALDFCGKGTLEGKTVAMQGVGNVGEAMLSELFERGIGRVIATDIDEERIQGVRQRFVGRPLLVEVTAPDDTSILEQPCDILALNALGGVLNPRTIPRVQAGIVCGAANNQLLDDTRDAALLASRDIVYVPDFVANRMGIVHCANEQYGTLPGDPAIARHFGRSWDGSVFHITRRVLETARERGLTATRAANELADELARKPHPLWGNRARSIIDALVASRWHEG